MLRRRAASRAIAGAASETVEIIVPGTVATGHSEREAAMAPGTTEQEAAVAAAVAAAAAAAAAHVAEEQAAAAGPGGAVT
jgi:hypothetical protein